MPHASLKFLAVAIVIIASVFGTKHKPIALRISASQLIYPSGQPIMVKIEAINQSAGPIALQQVSPWHAARLIITRDGAPVKANGEGSSLDWRFSAQALLRPRQAYAYHWHRDAPSYAYTYFNALTYWGYAALPPGRYTIVAQPVMVSAFSHGHALGPDAATASNELRIYVTN